MLYLWVPIYISGMAKAVSPFPNVPEKSLESYKMDIVACDLNVIESCKSPKEATKSLYFNAYLQLTQIFSNWFNVIKTIALDASRMQQVVATEEQVRQASDIRNLFECLEVDKNWNDLHFLDVAIMSLPPRASTERDAAHLILDHYKSHLRAYTKATSIKEGRNVFGRLLHKRLRGGLDKFVVTEVTVNEDIDKYSCKDCLDLWKLFLIEALEIPED